MPQFCDTKLWRDKFLPLDSLQLSKAKEKKFCSISLLLVSAFIKQIALHLTDSFEQPILILNYNEHRSVYLQQRNSG